MKNIHISVMKDLHNKKNEEFVSDIISYIKANNITEEDFFSWWENQDFFREETKSFLEDMEIIALDWDFYFGE